MEGSPRSPERSSHPSIVDARQELQDWRRDYNEVRPHSSLGDLPPAALAAQIQGVAPALCSQDRDEERQAGQIGGSGCVSGGSPRRSGYVKPLPRPAAGILTTKPFGATRLLPGFSRRCSRTARDNRTRPAGQLPAHQQFEHG